MELEVTTIGPQVACARLVGRLDAAGADTIGLRFSAAVAAAGHNTVVDMAGVSFVASMGMRLLIATARALHAKGARMVMYGAQPLVKDALEQAAIDQIIPLVDGQQQALDVLALN